MHCSLATCVWRMNASRCWMPLIVSWDQSIYKCLHGSIRTSAAFCALCEHAREVLTSDNVRQFETLFVDFRSFVLCVPFIVQEGQTRREFELTNRSIFEAIDCRISDLPKLIADLAHFDAIRIKDKIHSLRSFGNFVADRCTLFLEEFKCCEHGVTDKWLEKINALCCEHFEYGRDLSRIRHYAVLGITPSATMDAVKKAYKSKARIYHPDKNRSELDGDCGAKFRRIKESYDELESARTDNEVGRSKPCDNLLRSMSSQLQAEVKQYMTDQRYEEIGRLLFKLPGLHVLDDLVDPQLDSDAIKSEIFELVKNQVQKVGLEVDTNWSKRDYKALNENFVDLDLMERHFSSYPNIMSKSWRPHVYERIKDAIEELGKKARSHIANQTIATQDRDSFRRHFIDMGFVLVELPQMKMYTKRIMSGILESCLKSSWGYFYVFELGLSLQRGDDAFGEDENRVAQLVVSEFNHFKEVHTMAWNEETNPKPVEDTVPRIKREWQGAILEQIDSAAAITNLMHITDLCWASSWKQTPT